MVKIRDITIMGIILFIIALCFVGCDTTDVSTAETTSTEVQTDEANETEAANITGNVIVAATVTGKTEAETTNAAVKKTTESINFDTVKAYSSSIALYDFTKSKSAGGTDVTETTINYEGLYGITGKITNNDLAYHFYTHTTAVDSAAPISFYKYGDKNAISTVKYVGSDDKHIDLSDLDNGLYYLVTNVNVSNSTDKVVLYVYVNGNDNYLCSRYVGSAVELRKKRNYWFETLNAVNPKDCLSLDEMTYPTSGAGGHVNHVSLWSDKAKTLVTDDSWSDEAKVFAFVNYIYKNIAYDNYKVYTIKTARAKAVSTDTYDGYSDDNNFAYYNGVGVCWDYTNILAIMCRTYNIPCTSVDIEKHTYNAVYLNGHWVLIDITRFAQKCCNSEDTTKVVTQSVYNQKFTSGYGNYMVVGYIVSIGKQIWTYDNATNPDNNTTYTK